MGPRQWGNGHDLLIVLQHEWSGKGSVKTMMCQWALHTTSSLSLHTHAKSFGIEGIDKSQGDGSQGRSPEGDEGIGFLHLHDAFIPVRA